MNTQLKLSTNLLITLLGIVGFSYNALAGDAKVFPGSNCHYGALTPSSNVKYDSTGFIYNSSTTHSALISCPIVKDVVFSGVNELNLVKIRYRKPTSVGFNCTIHSRTNSGTGGLQKSQWDFGFAGVKTMSLPSVGGFLKGAYTLSCILPPSKSPVSTASNRSGIYHYRINEK